MKGTRTGETTCADGTVIAHLTAGNGPPLVMLPGWSQTAQIFTRQLESLSDSWQVFAIDHRGHGASSVPDVGYHIHRLAADLHDVLSANDLEDVRLLGHSMGCAVIWSYLELFGRERLAALVLVDQMPCALRDPAWTDETALEAGATMDAAGLFAFTGQLRGDGHDPRTDFLTDVTSPGIGRDELAWLIEQGVRFDRRLAADLLFDVATHDWRPLIPHITLPTLVVAGDSVNVPIASQRWMSRQIPGAQFSLVAGTAGGTHFPFLENGELFDAELTNFLVTAPAN